MRIFGVSFLCNIQPSFLHFVLRESTVHVHGRQVCHTFALDLAESDFRLTRCREMVHTDNFLQINY